MEISVGRIKSISLSMDNSRKQCSSLNILVPSSMKKVPNCNNTGKTKAHIWKDKNISHRMNLKLLYALFWSVSLYKICLALLQSQKFQGRIQTVNVEVRCYSNLTWLPFDLGISILCFDIFWLKINLIDANIFITSFLIWDTDLKDNQDFQLITTIILAISRIILIFETSEVIE